MATPRQVYDALLAKGASTTQAIGILANVINESGFNEEAVGDQGTSFGIVQQHGAQYARLVTGNRPVDLNNQVNSLAADGGFKAASGANAGEAAGNFSANFERCQGCQPGGPQYNSRVANAATVAGWVSSGKWPTSAGSATAAGDTGSSAAAGPNCLWSIGGQHVGILFGHGPTLPSACLITKTEMRAFIGAWVLVAGFALALPGLILVAAWGFKSTKTGQQVIQLAGAVPGVGGAAAKTAGRASKASAPSSRSSARRSSPAGSPEQST